MNSILVPLDGSSFAEHALPLALGLAQAAGARLCLVTVHGLSASDELREVVRESHFRTTIASAGEAYLHAVARRIKEVAGIEAEVELLRGVSVRTLTAFIRRERIDLVVMSTHGRGGLGRAWLGSVAQSLIRQVALPILLVRPGGEGAVDLRPQQIRRVLVALDGSPAAESALRAAQEICELEGAESVLLRVVVPPMHAISPSIVHTARYLHDYIEAGRREGQGYLTSIGAELGGGPRQEVVVDHHPARAILRSADETGADLIALGTSGAGTLGRMFVGSVADSVVRGSTLPVLVSQGMTRTQLLTVEAAGTG
jgi:nucleotide-binding universal stress UspA family protein